MYFSVWGYNEKSFSPVLLFRMFFSVVNRTDINYFSQFVDFINYQIRKKFNLCFSEFFAATATIDFRIKNYFFYFLSYCLDKSFTQSFLFIFIPCICLIIILLCKRVQV